ncbi:hypothetical protein OH77DRAFT_1421542 [Trametes cingulata]|nr:hypothetical protein OH77DRAFT_1421542 [Trametes cingulata]
MRFTSTTLLVLCALASSAACASISRDLEGVVSSDADSHANVESAREDMAWLCCKAD